jgi:hypothetical protein
MERFERADKPLTARRAPPRHRTARVSNSASRRCSRPGCGSNSAARARCHRRLGSTADSAERKMLRRSLALHRPIRVGASRTEVWWWPRRSLERAASQPLSPTGTFGGAAGVTQRTAAARRCAASPALSALQSRVHRFDSGRRLSQRTTRNGPGPAIPLPLASRRIALTMISTRWPAARRRAARSSRARGKRIVVARRSTRCT